VLVSHVTFILKSVRFDVGYHLNNIQMCYFRI